MYKTFWFHTQFNNIDNKCINNLIIQQDANVIISEFTVIYYAIIPIILVFLCFCMAICTSIDNSCKNETQDYCGFCCGVFYYGFCVLAQ